MSGQLKGKFAYMAPEQASGKGLDHRSDLFALGLVLYELLTGVRPLQREGELATLAAAKMCEIPPPSSVTEEISPELDAIVMRALAPRPDDRYQDARELQMDLEEYLIARRWVATSLQISELMDILFSDKPQSSPKGVEVPEITAPVEAYPPSLAAAPSARSAAAQSAKSATPSAKRDPDATYIFQLSELEAQAKVAAEEAAAAAAARAAESLPEEGAPARFVLKRRPHRIEVRRLSGPQRWARRRSGTELQTTALERRVQPSSNQAVKQALAQGRVFGAKAWELGKVVGGRGLSLLGKALSKLREWSQARMEAMRENGAQAPVAPRPPTRASRA
jgi:hypothetical protein